jgi:hypothetical protein
MKLIQLVMFGTVVVCSENLLKLTDTFSGQNVVFFNVKPGGLYDYHCPFKD